MNEHAHSLHLLTGQKFCANHIYLRRLVLQSVSAPSERRMKKHAFRYLTIYRSPFPPIMTARSTGLLTPYIATMSWSWGEVYNTLPSRLPLCTWYSSQLPKHGSSTGQPASRSFLSSSGSVSYTLYSPHAPTTSSPSGYVDCRKG